MTIYSVGSNQVSPPRQAPHGSIVTVTPGTGATAMVESTNGSAADIANRLATWVQWPQGVVSIPATMRANDNIFIRVTATGGDVVFDIEESPTARALEPFRQDWQTVASGITTPLYVGSNICIAGDSIGEMQTNMNISGGKVFFARGWVNWMQSFLGYPWEFEPEDNYAVSGASFLTTLQQQLPVLLAAHRIKKYTRCFISDGTNDTVNGSAFDTFTLQQIKNNALAVFQTLRNAGIIPVYTGVPARGADTEALRYKAWAANLNEWFYQLGQSGLIEYIPRVQQVFADPGSAYGNSAAGMTYDNTHPSTPGGMLAGWEAAEHFRARGVGPNMRFATVTNDVFDRTDNPTGSLFANPVLAGTAGSGSTIAPTGYTTSIGAGTGAWSKVARAQANGTSRSDLRCTFGGAGINMLISPNMLGPASGGWASDGSKLLPGDVIETRAKVVVSGASNLREVQLRLVESNGVAAAAHYGMNSQDTTLPLPMSDFTLYLKSPRVTVRPYGGSGQVLMYSRLEMTTIGTSAGTADVQAFEVRKVG